VVGIIITIGYWKIRLPGIRKNFHPTRYTVDFPDGRVETFRAVTWDSVYRVQTRCGHATEHVIGFARERLRATEHEPEQPILHVRVPWSSQMVARSSSRPPQHVANGHYYYKYHATGHL